MRRNKTCEIMLSTGDLPGVYLPVRWHSGCKRKEMHNNSIWYHSGKRKREVLRKAAGSFRAIFENNSEAIAIVEKDSTISMVNDAYCEMSGYSKQDVIGKLETARASWRYQIHEAILSKQINHGGGNTRKIRIQVFEKTVKYAMAWLPLQCIKVVKR